MLEYILVDENVLCDITRMKSSKRWYIKNR